MAHLLATKGLRGEGRVIQRRGGGDPRVRSSGRGDGSTRYVFGGADLLPETSCWLASRRSGSGFIGGSLGVSMVS